MRAKKLLSVILAVVMVVVTIPVTTVVAEDITEGYYTYTVKNGKATVLSVSEEISGEVSVPSSLGGYTVTRLEDYAFWNCYNITSVAIPGSVTYVGYECFKYCSALESIVFGNGIEYIGGSAFVACESLTDITLPSKVHQ